MTSPCIPPIRWAQRWLLPPRGTGDWQRIAFQPMLYLFLWVAAIIILLFGDFTTVPPELADNHDGLYWVWGGLSLVCPPLALVSLWLIDAPNGYTKYRGLWLRLAADIGQFTATLVYTILRLQIGDYHVYTMACLLACTVFTGHLVIRDARRLHKVEKLAATITVDRPDGS